ncbi:M28 family peptidase [Paucibacter sp. TC2R-5]|uniref:M28 family peptidase n=1 Tax=Paucibacter sp. TC2R-5 TaxID=2893555 RepID=UPI0021E51640|nr:M28 family peptidase [Paucibacter sp. TC2R-5]MCV2360331.1 M28 family peptidase [Paucibacter sp. TC2R-5]
MRFNALLFSLTAALSLTGPAWAQNAASAGPVVDEVPLRAHLALLSSDLFEGRGTGQRGGELTVAYLETQAKVLGLQPAAPGGSYRQAVRLLGTRTLQAQSQLRIDGDSKSGPMPVLKFGSDWVYGSGNAQAINAFGEELVFAGYGISAPEERWDDFKGLDLRGKVLIVLANDPYPTEAEPGRFAGKAMTIYGRRAYKFEEALRRGAKGVLVLHTEASTLSSWSVVSQGALSEQFQLDGGKLGLPLQGWISQPAAQQLFASAGLDLDALRAQAESREFKPVPLGLRLQGELHTELRRLEQFNIAGLVPGSDPKLKDELVIYTAHWDHIGKTTNASGETQIFNGAVDNASGTAALLAMAQAAALQPARRSQMFLWVAAEEQGLLGSAWYTQQPLWPLARTAANLNLDTLNFVGRTRDIGAHGAERSDLGAVAAQVAEQMGLSIAPPRVDVGGYYFRSDHFSFAKAGVPAFSVSSGSQYHGDVAAQTAKRAAYGQRYHQSSDRYDPSWDLSGMREQAQYTLTLGRSIGNAEAMPAWKAGDPFGAVKR